MTVFRSSRCARSLALILIVALYLLPGASLPVFAAQQPVAARQSLLVFPFDKAAQGVSEEMGVEFAAALKTAIAGANGYVVMAFSERLPSVQRGLTDGSLKKEDVSGPFAADKTQREKAVKLASSMGMDLALIGSIDEYKYDAAKKQVDMTVTAEVVDVKSGKTAKMLTVSGRSPEGKATEETELMALAAGDAVNKAAVGVTPDAAVAAANGPQQQPKQSAYEQPKKKKSWFKKMLVPILLIAAVGVAAASGGDDGGDGGVDPPPSGF